MTIWYKFKYICQKIYSMEKFKLSKIKANPKNPRKIEDGAIDRLCKKIEEYPKFLSLRPIVVDDVTMQVLGGTQRLKALQKLGYKEVDASWVRFASNLTEQEKQAFIVIDNLNDGEWDFELLSSDFGDLDLEGFGLDLEGFGEEKQKNNSMSDEEIDNFFKDDDTEEKPNTNKIILEYSDEDFEFVNKRLKEIGGSKEQIVYKLLEV